MFCAIQPLLTLGVEILNVPQVYFGSICKVLIAVAAKALSNQQRLESIREARQFILAWGLKRA